MERIQSCFSDESELDTAERNDSHTSLDFTNGTIVKHLSLDDIQQKISIVENKRQTRFSSVVRQTSKIQETQDEIWLRRVQLCVSKLTMLDPVRRAGKANLYRYFHIWSLCLPLTQKCNELGKQLRERNAALATVRDSYNKDCIA